MKLEGVNVKYPQQLQKVYALFLFQFEQIYFYRASEKVVADSGTHIHSTFGLLSAAVTQFRDSIIWYIHMTFLCSTRIEKASLLKTFRGSFCRSYIQSWNHSPDEEEKLGHSTSDLGRGKGCKFSNGEKDVERQVSSGIHRSISIASTKTTCSCPSWQGICVNPLGLLIHNKIRYAVLLTFCS